MGPVLSPVVMPRYDPLCCLSYLYVLCLYKGSGCSHHDPGTITSLREREEVRSTSIGDLGNRMLGDFSGQSSNCVLMRPVTICVCRRISMLANLEKREMGSERTIV